MVSDNSKLYFIYNPYSAGVLKRGSFLKKNYQRFNAQLHSLEKFSDVELIVCKALKNNASHICIEGGDGTIHGVMTEFLKQSPNLTLPSFMLIPGGNTNQISRNIGIKSTSIKALERSLKIGSTINFPMLSITDDKNNSYYGFLFSSGALPQMTEYTKKRFHQRGIGGSAAVLGGMIKGLKKKNKIVQPTKIKIDIETLKNHTIDSLHFGSIITTLPSLILKLDPFWGKEEFPLRFTYASSNYKRFFKNVISLWLGKKNKSRKKYGLLSWNAIKIKFYYTGPCMLDGESLKLSDRFIISSTKPIKFIR
ncbi:MAG: diacylglycerol kinase family protein [Hellea sp.]|nr:diacylglycerol kinase family protein [Hellea sp.]